MADMTLPPSYLLALDAFENATKSNPSLQSHREVWKKDLSYADAYVLTSTFTRQFASEEIEHLPTKLQQLGTALHMAQDLAMPHHAQGIGGLCHSEFEQYVDEISCRNDTKIDSSAYETGLFDEVEMPSCQALDDVAVVERLMAHDRIFNAHSGFSLEDRLIELAKRSAQWKVQAQDDWVSNGLKIFFKNQVVFSGTCQDIRSSPSMAIIAKYQYQLATAATIMIIELAALEYAKHFNRIASVWEQCEMEEQSRLSG